MVGVVIIPFKDSLESKSLLIPMYSPILPVIFHDPVFFGLSRALVFSEPNYIRD